MFTNLLKMRYSQKFLRRFHWEKKIQQLFDKRNYSENAVFMLLNHSLKMTRSAFRLYTPLFGLP